MNPYKKYIQPIFCACVISVIIMALPGCETVPVIQSVKHHQEGYVMPERFITESIKIDKSQVNALCGPRQWGCLKILAADRFILYFTGPDVFEHECKHQARGNNHNKVRR